MPSLLNAAPTWGARHKPEPIMAIQEFAAELFESDKTDMLIEHLLQTTKSALESQGWVIREYRFANEFILWGWTSHQFTGGWRVTIERDGDVSLWGDVPRQAHVLIQRVYATPPNELEVLFETPSLVAA